MILTRVSAPAPILSIDEAREHLRRSEPDDVPLIETLIAAVSNHLDGPYGILGRCIMAQQWTVRLSSWSVPLVLPVEPVTQAAISYVDASGVSVSLAAEHWQLEAPAASAPHLVPVDAWPVLGAARWPVTLTLTCGGAAAPADIAVAAKMLLGHWYEHREAVVVGAITAELPMACDALLAPYRRLV